MLQRLQPTRRSCLTAVSFAALVTLGACGGGGGGENSVPMSPQVTVPPPPTPTLPPPPPPPPPSTGTGAFATSQSTSRFLTQATFGPTQADVSALTGTSASAWFSAELQKPASLNVPQLQAYRAMVPEGGDPTVAVYGTTFSFWRNAIEGNDQLRQRMAFALSQILVVSNFGGETLSDIPEAVSYYQDVLTRNAFGNYRDLLEEVTYSPAMGHYLTYMGNERADPVTGRMPDENYAREILQLFTLGVIQLGPDGEPVRDSQGQPIELYTNRDITGLARVFTGLNVYEFPDDNGSFPDVWLRPMVEYPESVSAEPKQFLNCSIPANTNTADSIDQALDCIMGHPNVAPFVSRQLIQRFTTSDPDADYVQRVATAFDNGRYLLPNGTQIGDGRKGDLSATLAAVLFDADVRASSALQDAQFGKVREPLLRFTQWARAFDADASHPEYGVELWDLSEPSKLSQHPYRARSVFNFYRPGYIAPGTRSGGLGMTAPELQIVNASSTPGYINFIMYWAYGGQSRDDYNELAQEITSELQIPIDRTRLENAFVPNYSDELALANDPTALVDHLDNLLAYGSLSAETKTSIVSSITLSPVQGPGDTTGLRDRVALAVSLVMTSPDYLVQR
ncbi:MAG: DUF1800 family protein [Pseudomonadota bacterium]